MNADAPINDGGPALFDKPAKEIWRWYAWTRMKISERKRWIPTCWKFDSKREALENSARPLMEDDTLLLVCESTTYTANAMIEDQSNQPAKP